MTGISHPRAERAFGKSSDFPHVGKNAAAMPFPLNRRHHGGLEVRARSGQGEATCLFADLHDATQPVERQMSSLCAMLVSIK